MSNINKLNLLCKNKFLEKLEYYEKLYGCIKTYCEFYSSNRLNKVMQNSIKYGYNRPEIYDDNSENSFIDCKDLRHPYNREITK